MKTNKILIVAICIMIVGACVLIGGYTNNLRRMNLQQNDKVEITLLYGEVLPEIKLSVKYLDTNKTLVLDGLSADAFPNGDIIYVGKDYSLRKVLFNGEEEVILEKEQASSQIFLNQNATMAVYTKPKDFEGGNIPFTNGIAVYDFNTNMEKVLLMEEGSTILHCGWLEEKIIIQTSTEKNNEFLLLDLAGNLSKFETKNLLPRSRTMSLRSLDGRYLAYESTDGDVIVVDLTTGCDTRIKNSLEPRWTKQGLRVREEGGYKIHKLQ